MSLLRKGLHCDFADWMAERLQDQVEPVFSPVGRSQALDQVQRHASKVVDTSKNHSLSMPYGRCNVDHDA